MLWLVPPYVQWTASIVQLTMSTVESSSGVLEAAILTDALTAEHLLSCAFTSYSASQRSRPPPASVTQLLVDGSTSSLAKINHKLLRVASRPNCLMEHATFFGLPQPQNRKRHDEKSIGTHGHSPIIDDDDDDDDDENDRASVFSCDVQS